MTTTLTVAAKVNGTDYGIIESCNEFPTDEFQAVSFGSFASGGCHFDIRDIKVGTTAYGSSDLFFPILNDLLDFTGVFGDDGSIVATGGVLSVDGSGDHYGYFTFPVAQTGNVFMEFELRVRPGDGSPDYADIFSDSTQPPIDGSQLDGIYNGGGEWCWDGCGVCFGSGPTGDPVWDTINLAYSWTGGPPGENRIHIAS